MSINLDELNYLAKKHNYFMANNRMNICPNMKDNSLFLNKILRNKLSYSTDKDIKYKEIHKPKNVFFLKKLNNIDYDNNINNNKESIIIKVNQNNSNFNNNRYSRKNYYNTENPNIKKSISPYDYNSKSKLKNDSIEDNYSCNKTTIKNQKGFSSMTGIFSQYPHTLSTSNLINTDNDMVVLNHKGKKIFNRNISSFNSIDKNLHENKNKGSELYRNTEELKRKKEEIYQKKMKRESSALKREIYKREMDKDIKDEKLNIDINSKNNSINNKSKSKNKYNSVKGNIIEFNDNNELKCGINQNNDILNNIPVNINFSNIKKRNKNSLDKATQTNSMISRISKYKINRNNFTSLKKINTKSSNNNSIKISPINNNYNIIYSKKNLNNNNIFLSIEKENTPSKNINNNNNSNINNRIKENLDYLRKLKTSGSFKNKNNYFSNQLYTPEKHNIPYHFSSSKKRFIEDYITEPPIIYSNDKKLTIKVHTLQNINEYFFGKKMTKDKLRIQRALQIIIGKDNKKNGNYFKNKNIYIKVKSLKNLSTIKEEEKIQKNYKPNLIKKEQKNEKMENYTFKKNTRMKYLKNTNQKK